MYFGEAMSVTYIDHGAGAANAYFGGAVNNCFVTKKDDECWMLAINRVYPTGLMKSQTQINW